jgi:hypothetical protein
MLFLFILYLIDKFNISLVYCFGERHMGIYYLDLSF